MTEQAIHKELTRLRTNILKNNWAKFQISTGARNLHRYNQLDKAMPRLILRKYHLKTRLKEKNYS